MSSSKVVVQKGSGTVDAFLLGDILDPEEYTDLILLLLNAPKDVTIRLHINTDGGSLDTADTLYTTIKSSKANVVAHTYGLVASAGTIVVAACSSVVLSPGTKFLLHRPSSAGIDQLHVVVGAAWGKNNRDYLTHVYGKMLHDVEMRELLSGKDVFLSYAQLTQRFK